MVTSFEAAQMLGVGRQHVQQLYKAGRLRGRMRRRQCLVRGQRFIARRKVLHVLVADILRYRDQRRVRVIGGPGISRTLVEVTAKHLDPRIPRMPREIWESVVDDHGGVSSRQVRRALHLLVRQGRALQTETPRGGGFYVRTPCAISLRELQETSRMREEELHVERCQVLARPTAVARAILAFAPLANRFHGPMVSASARELARRFGVSKSFVEKVRRGDAAGLRRQIRAQKVKP